MRRGDRVVVLETEQHGEITRITRYGLLWVQLDDVDVEAPFDPFELELANAPHSARHCGDTVLR